MAVTGTLTNHFKYQMASGESKSPNTFRGVLMDTSFTFDKDTDSTYAIISANEIAASNGYSASGELLTGQTLTEDDANDRANLAWDDVTWTATGGAIEDTIGMCIVDFTSADDTVLGYLDFDGTQSVPEDATLTVSGLTFRLT